MLPDTKLANPITGTATSTPAAIALAQDGRPELWQLTNTGEATLYYAGAGSTASAASHPLDAGESTGWIASNDRTLSVYCATSTTYRATPIVQA